MARGGLTLIETVVVIAIVAILAALTIAGVQAARQAACRAECSNQLRQIGLSLHQHHDHIKQLPSGIVHPRMPPGFPRMFGPDTDPYPLSTWHMRILPFIEQDALWAAVTAAYAQDSYQFSHPPHPREIPVPLFLCPAYPNPPPGMNGSGPTSAMTSYMGVSGKNWMQRDGVFYMDSAMRFAKITDGLSNTIAVGERPPSRDGIYGRWYGGWGHWGTVNSYLGVREMAYGIYARQCPEGPYHFQAGRLDDPCSVYHYWSFHSGGANFLFADGSVRFLGYSADPLLPALSTRAGNDPATLPD